jgi:ribonuclease E
MKKEMLINVLQPEECRIAIVEDGVLEELYVERTSLENYTGNIYKGRVVNIEPAIQAAFVDFSVGRNGFLHVSDVEPQYYRRLLDGEPEPAPRERPGREPRSARGEERPGRGPSAAPPSFGPADDLPGEWARDQDRPDRSEKGRRDRSTRRFGEGLADDLEPLASPPPSPSRPSPPEPEEPIPSWSERRGEPPRSREAARERAERPALPPSTEEPRGRLPRPVIDPIEAMLPPSRTHRSRPSAPPPPRHPEADLDLEAEEPPPAEIERPERLAEPEPRPAAPEPRRGRGRARAQRAPEPPPIPEEAPEAFPHEPEDTLVEPLTPPSPRRRGGRDAIRSRGGAERPREASPQHPRGLAAERPYEPPAEFERPAAELPPAEPVRGPREPARPPREHGRDRERPAPERTGARAGEPGYVPRRERVREPEPFEPEAPTAPLLWGEEEFRDAGYRGSGEAEAETELIESEEPSTEAETRRRRRRRRRRRGERPDREAAPSAAADFELEELEVDAIDQLDLEPSPIKTRGEIDELEEPGIEIEEEDEELEPVRLARAVDEEIDPELEEEIRREIQEIEDLEREMGLRGPSGRRPEEREAPGRGPRGRGAVKPPIQDIFRRGDEVLVQVIKESIGTKGPTLSTYISIPGRYLVLMPGLNRVGVSRKIADEAQRRRLREIMNALNPPKGLGFIVRTAGLDRTKRELARDLAYLLRLWKVILKRIRKAKAPAPIYQESDMITRTIRDVFSADIDTIWIDEPQAFERAQEFLRVVMPKFVNRLRLYDEKVPLFHKYGIEEEIAKIQRRHVPLPEGGSIVIDPTEALVAIDVNSGNFRVEDDAERTAYEMNLRAAKEIARQLRLRDLGGVIVNDFIDMRDERHRRGVERALREAVQRDRARTKILRMSQFGLIEMTRQRIRPSLKRSIYEDCQHCKGAGVVKTVESMSIDVMRLLALAAHRNDIRRINVCVSPAVATHLNNRKRPELSRLEAESNLTIYIHHEENAPAEHLHFECFDAHGGEVRILPPPQPAHPKRGR